MEKWSLTHPLYICLKMLHHEHLLRKILNMYLSDLWPSVVRAKRGSSDGTRDRRLRRVTQQFGCIAFRSAPSL